MRKKNEVTDIGTGTNALMNKNQNSGELSSTNEKESSFVSLMKGDGIVNNGNSYDSTDAKIKRSVTEESLIVDCQHAHEVFSQNKVAFVNQIIVDVQEAPSAEAQLLAAQSEWEKRQVSHTIYIIYITICV